LKETEARLNTKGEVSERLSKELVQMKEILNFKDEQLRQLTEALEKQKSQQHRLEKKLFTQDQKYSLQLHSLRETIAKQKTELSNVKEAGKQQQCHVVSTYETQNALTLATTNDSSVDANNTYHNTIDSHGTQNSVSGLGLQNTT